VRALYSEMANACGGARLETEEFELDGPDDLLSLGQHRLSTLTLRGNERSIFVYFSRYGAAVRR
jgi:hypothetical protein